tara:strand:- start:1928 stop:2218 length:291 start_codon:yes stop_codon:yes gene_type:complete
LVEESWYQKPYIDTYIDEKTFLRSFFHSNKEKFIWHSDLVDRKVEILHADYCFFQFDNQMPFELKLGDIIEIPKGQIHRIILSKGGLILKISEVKL